MMLQQFHRKCQNIFITKITHEIARNKPWYYMKFGEIKILELIITLQASGSWKNIVFVWSYCCVSNYFLSVKQHELNSYNVKNGCPSTWILNRSGKILRYTMNKGKIAIKKYLWLQLNKFSPEHVTLKSYYVSNCYIFITVETSISIPLELVYQE